MNSVFITGATSGIGLELTRQYCESGDHVIAAGRNLSSASDLNTLKEKYPEQIILVELDVDDTQQIAELSEKLSAFSIDILINNAGISSQKDYHFLEFDAEQAQKTFRTNSIAPVLICRALLPLLSKNAKVIQISSGLGSIQDNNNAGFLGYRMSKAALNMFTKSLSVEQKNLIAVSICPGWVQTRMGGEHAPTRVQDSVRAVIKIIGDLSKVDSGKYLSHDGRENPW